MTNDDVLGLIVLNRQVTWALELDDWTTDSLKTLSGLVGRAESQILRDLTRYSASVPSWKIERTTAILEEFDSITSAIQTRLVNDITEIAGEATLASFEQQNDIVSFGGRVQSPEFEFVGLTGGQARAMVQDASVYKYSLETLVGSVYERAVNRVQNSLNTGMLVGDSFPQFANRLKQEFGIARKDAAHIARTYVASVNNFAAEQVFQANRDIVRGVKWVAVLEPGFSNSGFGTCLRCASMDGKEFRLDETRPVLPLHPNCRCLYVPTLVSYRELGLDIDEVQDAYRPFTIRPNEAIDLGGRRTIIEHGFHDGNYGSWFKGRDDKFKLELLGKKRFELYQQGKVQFDDFVDKPTGKLLTIQELTN